MLRSLVLALAASVVTSVTAIAEPVRFAVTDIEGLEALQQEFGGFQEALEAETGLDIELISVSSRTAAVEALNAGQVELVLTGPAEYVVMKELSDPRIVVAWQRPDYFAQLAVLADGPIRTIEDLKGKKIAFGSVGSTSQHLGPAQALADQLMKGGLDIVTGGTDSHLMLVDLRPKNVKGNATEDALGRANITCNKNGIPFDPEKPAVTSGIRLGSPAGTTRGFGEAEFRQIADWIVEVVDGLAANGAEGNADVEAKVRGEVEALCERFPLYPNL